jgi:hypothetical protein
MQTMIQHKDFVSSMTKASAQVALVSSTDGWTVQTRSRNHACVLMAERSKSPRVFRRLETATEYLRKLGVKEFVVDMAEPIRPQTPDHRKRPDQSAAMQRTFQSAKEWQAWFDAQVQAAVKQADSSKAQWVSNDDAKKQWGQQRQTLLTQIK